MKEKKKSLRVRRSTEGNSNILSTRVKLNGAGGGQVRLLTAYRKKQGEKKTIRFSNQGENLARKEARAWWMLLIGARCPIITWRENTSR